MAKSAIEWNAAGITRSAGDARYVKRLVGAALAADTYAQNGRNILAAPDAVYAGVPQTASATLLSVSNTRMFASVLKVLREANIANAVLGRFNGTWAAPTAVLINEIAGQYTAEAYDGATMGQIAVLRVVARENISATARGAAWDTMAADVGTTAMKSLTRTRGGGAGIAELLSLQTTLRMIPVTTVAGRNPTNTGNVWEWGADTYALFGGTPVTRRAAIANPVDLATALTSIIAILDALRPTTGINLIAP